MVFREAHRVLKKNGQLIAGFVPATGKWGENLIKKKKSGHPFYKHARFFSTADVQKLLREQHFTVTAAVSSLYQAPGEVTETEFPQTGADEKAGFVVLLAEKGYLP